MHCKRIGQIGVGKYLRESYYHCIECSVVNSLAALISDNWTVFFSLTATPKDFRRVLMGQRSIQAI